MALTGFKPVNDDAKAVANKSFTISMGSSPFQDNVEFTVSDYDYRQAENDGKVDKDAYMNPVLVTSVGDLFLSTIVKAKVKADGTIIAPSGTFNVFVKNTIASMSGKSNGEILKEIVKGCAGKVLLVSRVPYAAKAKDDRKYAASLVNISFKD